MAENLHFLPLHKAIKKCKRATRQLTKIQPTAPLDNVIKVPIISAKGNQVNCEWSNGINDGFVGRGCVSAGFMDASAALLPNFVAELINGKK